MTLLAEVVGTSARVGEISGRRAKIAEIAALLRTLRPDEIDIGVAYLAGETPQGRKGIGYALIRDAQPEAAAQTPTLTLRDVDTALAAIGATAGRGSVAERKRLLAALLAAATATEQSFLVRLLLGELRQGALEGLMIEAVASAAGLPVADVRRAAMVAGGIAVVRRSCADEGRARGCAHSRSRCFSRSRRCSRSRRTTSTMRWLESPPRRSNGSSTARACRSTRPGDEVRIFTRTGNDVTPAAPEIVEAVRELPAQALILDGEAIALRSDGAPYPFQDTMRRFGRALEIERMRESMPLSVFFFDCLRRDDDDLVGRPARRALRCAGRGGSSADAHSATRHRRPRGRAGVLRRCRAAPARRRDGQGAGRTLRAGQPQRRVAQGQARAHARPRRARRRMGPRPTARMVVEPSPGRPRPNAGEFVMLGKTFKGMTDALLDWQTKALLEREVRRDEWTVYVRPELVVEITFNDLQTSPRYPGGLALRFARVKGYRPDKRPEDADTMDTVRAIYASQASPH